MDLNKLSSVFKYVGLFGLMMTLVVSQRNAVLNPGLDIGNMLFAGQENFYHLAIYFWASMAFLGAGMIIKSSLKEECSA